MVISALVRSLRNYSVILSELSESTLWGYYSPQQYELLNICSNFYTIGVNARSVEKSAILLDQWLYLSFSHPTYPRKMCSQTN